MCSGALISARSFLPAVFVSFRRPAQVVTSGGSLTRDQEREIGERFLDFYEDVFLEVQQFGEVSAASAWRLHSGPS